MTTIETTLIHDGVTYAATIVTIERTELGREDHGVFQASLRVHWGGAGTAIGGYVLDGKPNERGPLGKNHRTPTAYGMQWIIETITVVLGEYGKWEDLVNKRVFMLHETTGDRYSRAGHNCQGIASLDGERVMIFAEVLAHAQENVPETAEVPA